MTRFHPRVLAPTQKRLARVLGPWATARGFYLAGGTALALHLGHRESVDFDWFGPKDFRPGPLIRAIADLSMELDVRDASAGTVVGRIGEVNVSFFRYRYPLLGPLAEWSGMALASLPDLAAMKLAAVSDRNVKRDFIDIHELLGQYASLDEMVELFVAKYPKASVAHMLRALTYFAKADRQKMPRMFREVTWAQVKRGLRRAVDDVTSAGQTS